MGRRYSLKPNVLAAVVTSMGLLGAAPQASAQVRGFEFVGLVLSGGLTKTEGTLRLNWLPYGMGYVETEVDSGGQRTFYKVDPRNGRQSQLFDDGTVRRIVADFNRLAGGDQAGLPFESFTLEDDGNTVSFPVGEGQFVYDRGAKSMRSLMVPSVAAPIASGGASRTLSPDKNYFVVVRDHDNLFLFDTRTGEETRLTHGTSESNLVGFLGAGPWYVWSPDSKQVAYLTADQGALHEYPILHELTTKSDVEFIRYPFAGDQDPKVELHIVDIETKQSVDIAASTEEFPFIRDIKWLNDGSEVTFQLVNRWQSRVELKAANPATGSVRTIFVDEVETFLDPPHNFNLLEDGLHFTWSSERTGWRHIYLYDLQGNLVSQVTQGVEWETEDIVHIDEADEWIYFVGHTNFGMDRHFFRVKFDGSGITRLTKEDGFHVVSMDPAGEFYTDDHSSLTSPRQVDLFATDGSFIRNLASTDVSQVDALGLQPPEIFTLKTADGGATTHGILYKPVDFDPAKKYPVLVNVYGGPHTKAVRNNYQSAGFSAAVAQLGFLMVEFDARGTRLRGKAFQSGNYLRMGQSDVDDQAAAVRQLAERPYVDGSRVGVTGISHGGYLTTMMMLRYPDVFHVGAAGAPITDLSNGPKQYIGRIMRTPQANPEGYEKANALMYASQLNGKLLFYHGTNDQNAVMANTLQLVHELIEANKPVDMMIYPEGVHVLQGQNALHQLRTVIAYFVEHLKPENWQQTLEAIWP